MINIIVIVIAVIAILSAVLIPTFSNVVKDAQNAADEADAKAIYTEYVAQAAEDGLEVEEEVVIEITVKENNTDVKKYYYVKNGQYDETKTVTDANRDDANATTEGVQALYENVFKYKATNGNA